jgi:hypothetical protein
MADEDVGYFYMEGTSACDPAIAVGYFYLDKRGRPPRTSSPHRLLGLSLLGTAFSSSRIRARVP